MRLWVAPEGLHIEPAQIGDAPAIAEIHAASFYRGWTEDEMATYIRDVQTHLVYVACNKERDIAGFMILRLAADETELLTIAVARRWRNKRIGEAILRAGLDDLVRSPARHMFLEVEEENSAAIRLYRRFGFVSLNRREAYYDQGTHTKAAALVMRCELN